METVRVVCGDGEGCVWGGVNIVCGEGEDCVWGG